MSPSAQAQVQEEQVKRTGPVRRNIVAVVLGLGLVPLTLWAAAALYIDCRAASLRTPAAVGYLLAVLCTWVFSKRRLYATALTLIAFAMVLAWWLSLKPSNNRDWQKDVATLAYADINGNKVTLHNIRNCDYRTETDFDVRYYEKVLDLENLRSADLFMIYWGSPLMAHTMLSFGFGSGEYVCFSIETRKVKGESYSAFRGLFRQYELIYIVADERDLVRLRSNYRKGEEAYLYRLHSSKERLRATFLEYLRRLNSLRMQPEWYNAVTHNCTTSIREQRAASDRAPWDWRMLVNGYGNELLYERGLINTNLPLPELTRRAHINERARAADQAADFSAQIRKGVPGAGE
jgi:hypothetical protein